MQKSETKRKILYIQKHFFERRESIIGHVKAGRVRIYKLNTFKALTDAENEIYNDKKKKNVVGITTKIKIITIPQLRCP